MRIMVWGGTYSYWEDFVPSDIDDPKAKRQVGGGETAMINTSREMARRGHEVIAFYQVGRQGRYDGVDYLHPSLFEPLARSLESDVIVSWDQPWVLRQNFPTKLRGVAYQLNHTYIGVLDEMIDFYFCPSKWHAHRFSTELAPETTRSKWVPLMTNGVGLRRYDRNGIERDPYRVIYSSSPDRGLHHLLGAWKRIKAEVPMASLHIYYDFQKWYSIVERQKAKGDIIITADRGEAVKSYLDELVGDTWNVYHHGGIGQWELASEQMKSGLMVYPCDPIAPTEGYSMSCAEALASGAGLITTNADALGELWGEAATILPLPVNVDAWAEAIVRKLVNPPGEAERDLYRKFAARHSWKVLGKRWEDYFAGRLR